MDRICRTCTQTIIKEHFYVDGSIFAHSNLLVRDILLNCIPELDLNLVPDSVVCRNCISALYMMHQFKNECIRNEQVFQSRQHVRIRRFESTDERAMEVELDDVTALKTELVFQQIDANEVVEVPEENLESYVEVTVDDPDLKCGMYEEEPDCDDENESRLVAERSPKLIEDEENDEVGDDEHYETQEIATEDVKDDIQKFIECIGPSKPKRNVLRPFACPDCNFATDSKASLVMHSRIHTGEKPYQCPGCPYKAKRKAHLEDHMKTHTGEKPFSCAICNRSFITKQLLKKHELVHTEDKPYRCMQCNFQSRHKLSVSNHIKRIHIGMTPVSVQRRICYVCGKWLAGTASFNAHMKIHTGVKKHKCDLCGRSFREKSMLKNHLRIHTGEKPFRCGQCDYIATRKAHLQEHARTHGSDRELYNCIRCNKRYSTKNLLKKHVNEEHPKFIQDGELQPTVESP